MLGDEVASLGLGRIATAESCTGGLIAAAFTDTPGSSAWFSRGYVTYANEAKVEMLGVSADSLREQGAVSETVVAQMAEGTLRASDVFLGMAVSGIAGPDGGLPGKPVGTVCFGWAIRWPMQADGAPLVRTETRHFEGDRASVRQQTAVHALRGALRLIQVMQADQPPAC
ncbi:MAG: CinA family protein [Lautropia sp.]|nr:CinA family protein [Lautropia sp.]